MMKKIKKIIAVFSAVTILGLSVGTETLACNQTPGCEASNVSVVCGTQNATTVTHNVGHPNGSVTTCAVDTISAMHYIYCTGEGCGALIKTEYRTCHIRHSDEHCFDRNNLCQYP